MKWGPLAAGAGLFASLYWIFKPRAAMAASGAAAPADKEPAAPMPPSVSSSSGGSSSEGRIALLEPQIQPLARKLLADAKAQGLDLIVTQGLRTMAEQQALYDQGRTTPGNIVTNAKPGSSWHNFGLAFDVAVVVNGKPTWPNDAALWKRIGDIGKAAGLVWGGDFKSFVDMPHFEYHPGLTLEQARAGQKLP